MRVVNLLALCLATSGTTEAFSKAVIPESYKSSWESVNQHDPAPEWYQDAKFGIFFHWGAFMVSEYNDWYPSRMYDSTGDCYRHQIETYGDPFSHWGFNHFIDGKNDKQGHWVQFKPVLKSRGGNWDPDEYAELLVASGAKFGGPVMEHHDGYSMWDSKVNPWNSVRLGPKLNLAKLYVTAFRARGLKILAAMHNAFHFDGYFSNAPLQEDPRLKMLFGQLGDTAENQLWYDKLKEVIDEFHPDILYQDFDLYAVEESRRLDLLSYYYNQARIWGKEVVATHKDGLQGPGQVFDYERGGPSDITTPYWQTDDAVSSSSWTYSNGMIYFSPKSILNALIDRVSKGGNMLLSFSPMPDGTIPVEQKDLLQSIGTWLNGFGDAIYATRTWSVFGEGPTQMGGSLFNDPMEGTGQDIRYTRAKDTSSVYAIFLGWPGNGHDVNLTGLNSTRLTLETDSKVYLMGGVKNADVELPFTQDTSGLRVTFPTTTDSMEPAYVVRIDVKPRSTVALRTPAKMAVQNFPARALFVDATLMRNGISVPAGARLATVITPDGRVLLHGGIESGQDRLRIEGLSPGQAILVRFDP